MNEMELLFQASRTNPILHEAAVFVEAELRHLTQTLSRVHDIAIRGVGADTTPEEALATIAAYIEKRTPVSNQESSRARKPVVKEGMTYRDFINESITLQRGLTGAKPEKVCHWLFEVMGCEPEDALVDLFPGSGAVARAWESWKSQPSLLRPAPVNPWNEVAGMLSGL